MSARVTTGPLHSTPQSRPLTDYGCVDQHHLNRGSLQADRQLWQRARTKDFPLKEREKMNRFENRRARTGIELTAESFNARRGMSRWPRKTFRDKSETITSSLWSSALANLLLRHKNRSPFPARCSLERRNVAASKQSECCRSFSGGEGAGSRAPMPQGKACNSVNDKVGSDTGSTPVASIFSAVIFSFSVGFLPQFQFWGTEGVILSPNSVSLLG